MYSKESLKKVMDLLNECKKHYDAETVEKIRICISGGNRKIGRVMNVSLPPIMTCANCAHCCKYCYDVKACLQYPNTVIDARIRNLVLLEKDPDEFFRRIDNAMNRRRKNKFFRWHVAGDIINMDYFQRIIDNARRHPDFTIWTYTKNYSLVNEWIRVNGRDALPANLTIMFSKWDGLNLPNLYKLPVFACRMKDGNKDPMDWDSMWKCPGNCDICKAAGRGCIVGESSYADEH